MLPLWMFFVWGLLRDVIVLFFHAKASASLWIILATLIWDDTATNIYVVDFLLRCIDEKYDRMQQFSLFCLHKDEGSVIPHVSTGFFHVDEIVSQS